MEIIGNVGHPYSPAVRWWGELLHPCCNLDRVWAILQSDNSCGLVTTISAGWSEAQMPSVLIYWTWMVSIFWLKLTAQPYIHENWAPFYWTYLCVYILFTVGCPNLQPNYMLYVHSFPWLLYAASACVKYYLLLVCAPIYCYLIGFSYEFWWIIFSWYIMLKGLQTHLHAVV